MNLLRTEHLIKNIGRRFQLGPIDLSLRPAEVLMILGPRGSGKTTLLRLIWGFLRPDQGGISVFGMAPHLHQVRVRARTGYVAQSPKLSEGMTVRQHLQFVSAFYGGHLAVNVEDLLARFDIPSTAFVHELSCEERATLALISAVGHDPRLLLLDEPIAQTGGGTRVEILSFLKGLSKTRGVGIVVASDVSDDLNGLADRTVELDQGRLEKEE